MNTAQAIGIVSLLTLVSKVTGFFREIVIARGYGAGVATDAYRVALGISYLFFMCVGAALTTVLVPLFTRNMNEGGREKAFLFVRKLTTVTVLVTGLLSLCGVVFAPWIVRALAPGFRGEAYALSVSLTRILSPALLFTALAYVAAGTLQSMGQFTIPALMALPMNLFIIGAVFLLGERFGIRALVWATFAGLIGQFVVQWPTLRRYGYRFRWNLDLKDPSIRQAGILVAPVMLGTAVLQVNALVDRMFASNLPAGSISVLDYSNKLTGLATGIVVSAVVIVALPKFSQMAAEGRQRELIFNASRALGFLNAIIIPISAGLIVLRVPIVRFVYERGAFTPEATRLTAIALMFSSLGLIGYGLRELISQVFYALKDTITPMVNGVIAMLVNIFLLFIFVGRLNWGIAGMALATSCSFTFAGLLLIILLHRKVGGIGLGGVVGSFWKSTLSALIMSFSIWKLYPFIEKGIIGSGFFEQTVELGITIVIGAIVYVGAMILLRSSEVTYGWAKVKTKLAKKPLSVIGK